MSGSLKIELTDERGNRVSVEVQGHSNEYVRSFAEDAEKIAMRMLSEVRKKEAAKVA